MKPLLYPAGETAFDTNGISILADAVDCTVIEELNGQYELELQYPMEGIHFEDIDFRGIVLAKPDPVTDPQPFRIYRKTKPRNGIVTFYARHIAYDLMGVTVTPFSASNAPGALQALKDNAVTECPFAFWTDKTTAAAMSVKAPVSIWSLLGGSAGSVLDLYGGEYEFDRWTVKLHGRRGADRGVSIRYGKNLTTFEQDANNADCYTGVHPYWLGTDGTLVQLPEKILTADGDYGYTKIMPLDMSQEWDTAPTEAQLRTRAQQYMKTNDIGTPTVSWKVEFVQLEQTEEYKGKALLERVLVGDTVSVVFPKLKVNASARAVAVRYKPILERYESITIGSVKANIADTIVRQGKTIAQATKPTAMQAAVDRATSWITNGRGYMVAVKDDAGNWQEICSLDTPDINNATKVWRWNNGGFGFSANGYNGPYKVAITQDGEIVADFITTGTLNAENLTVMNLVADSIVSGKLSSVDGKTFFDLDLGVICSSMSLSGNTHKMLMGGGQLLISEVVNGSEKGIFDIGIQRDPETGLAYACISDGSVNPAQRGLAIRPHGGKLILGQTSVPTDIFGEKILINNIYAYWEYNFEEGCYMLKGTQYEDEVPA